MTLKKNAGFVIYFFLVFLNLCAAWFNIEILNLITKPLLLPALMLVVFLEEKPTKLRSLFITALLFSFFGDVLLLFVKTNANFFIGGLVSFLLAHVVYIIFFAKIKGESRAKPKLFYLYIFLVVVHFVELLYILYPGLGAMKLPVTIYAVIISIMLMVCLFVFFKVPPMAGKYFVTGAILFVISDSLLAINKFYMPFFQAGFFIMLTYCLAQFCLVKGYINLHETVAKNA